VSLSEWGRCVDGAVTGALVDVGVPLVVDRSGVLVVGLFPVRWGGSLVPRS